MNLPEKEVVELIKSGNTKQACIILMESLVQLNQEVEELRVQNTKYESILNNQAQKQASNGGQQGISIG